MTLKSGVNRIALYNNATVDCDGNIHIIDSLYIIYSLCSR